ncbi:cyclic pyranopterin phosphate synthase [Natronospira proteinivora]|uniref:GTP 3',8-cyclase n=1 Tax=Natronospira proteinivora TaxID=1807133 RepID=A0ABT1GAE5_9GAMM|nr:GTP 3',8-cyclase MoaA [Natronospira proteinivora]MCP1727278.1 cyclic pyranopterin phosphate synthase [Natronospira proteinivora]
MNTRHPDHPSRTDAVPLRHISQLAGSNPADDRTDLEDRFGRRFAYLRLSITDVCNFRCEYCLPNGYQGKPTGFLHQSEIERLVSTFAELGIRKIRITGGEPLVRKDALEIIAHAAATPGIEKVALTTNAFNLADQAEKLKQAGLSAVNVSLDSLDPAGFERITGDKRHAKVMAGIDAALTAGIDTVKINTVLLAGLNDHELPDFMEFVRSRPISVRFIELMQTADNGDYFRKRHVSGGEVAEQLLAAGWSPIKRGETDGPAVEYAHPDYAGRIGLITPYAAGFCDGCNRLRVTARGGLRLCLFGNGTHDLRPLLQDDADRPALKQSIFDALFQKDVSHFLHKGDYGDTPNLASTGG